MHHHHHHQITISIIIIIIIAVVIITTNCDILRTSIRWCQTEFPQLDCFFIIIIGVVLMLDTFDPLSVLTAILFTFQSTPTTATIRVPCCRD